MGAPFTLQQLLAPLTEPQVRARLLSFLQAGGIPAISEWAPNPTGLEMTWVTMVSQAINDLAQSGAPEEKQIAAIAASGLLKYAFGDWLTLRAGSFYLLPRDQATKTTFTWKLSSVLTAPPYTFQVGDVVLVGTSGRHYVSTASGTLQPGTAIQMPFAAEAEGADYNDQVFFLATAFAGVSVSPGGGDFTPVVHSGSSTGRISPRRTTGAVPTAHTFTIRIETAGEVGTATWSLAIDGGAFAAMGVLVSSVALTGGTSIDIGPGGLSPSFVAGDVFVFSTPGTPGYVQGLDEESDDALVKRCLARWVSLSLNVLKATVELWTHAAYPAASRVQVTAGRPDNNGPPGRFVVSVADSRGAIDQAVANTIAAYIRPKLSLATGEDVVVVSATTLPVTTRGNVKVSAEQVTAVQQAAQVAWVKYLGTVGIGGEVLLSKLEEIIMDAGAIDVGDVTTPTLNNVAANLQLGAGQVPVDGNATGLAGALTWMNA